MLPMLGLGALAGAGGGGLAGMLGGGGLGTLATAGLLGGSILGMSGDPKLRQLGGVGQTLSLAPFMLGIGAPVQNQLTTTNANMHSPGMMRPPAANIFTPMGG